jgi:hypothetical protein
MFQHNPINTFLQSSIPMVNKNSLCVKCFMMIMKLLIVLFIILLSSCLILPIGTVMSCKYKIFYTCGLIECVMINKMNFWFWSLSYSLGLLCITCIFLVSWLCYYIMTEILPYEIKDEINTELLGVDI